VTDIALERRLLADEGLEIQLREEWDAQLDYRSDRACDFRAKRLQLHIALVDDPSDLDGPEDQVMRNLERIGQVRFAAGISYNAAAFNSGTLREGQPLTRRGTHTVNTFRRETCPEHGGSLVAPATSSGFNNNITDRALVLPQQLDDPVTDEQLDAAARWGAALRRSGLADIGARWHGHRCVTAKGCPGQRAYDRIPELQRLTDTYTENGLPTMITDQDLEKIRDAVWNSKIETDGRTARKMLRQASKTAGVADQVANRVVELVQQRRGSDPTADDIRDAVKQALREGTDDDEQ
jgi:hypothetical protein